jgi:hypothetical protein
MKTIAAGLVQLGLTLYVSAILFVVGAQEHEVWLRLLLGFAIATPGTVLAWRFGTYRARSFGRTLWDVARCLMVTYPVFAVFGYLCLVAVHGVQTSYDVRIVMGLWVPAYGVACPIGLGLLSFGSTLSVNR